MEQLDVLIAFVAGYPSWQLSSVDKNSGWYRLAFDFKSQNETINFNPDNPSKTISGGAYGDFQLDSLRSLAYDGVNLTFVLAGHGFVCSGPDGTIKVS